MALSVTQGGLNRMVAGTFDPSQLVAVLTNGDAIANTTTGTYSDLSGEVTGTGYAQKDIGVSQTGSVLSFSSDLTYTEADFTDADQIIIIQSATGAGSLSASDPIVAVGDATVEPNGTTVTIADHANGFFGLTLPA